MAQLVISNSEPVSQLYELDKNLVNRFRDLVIELSELRAQRILYPNQKIILQEEDVQLLFKLYDSLEDGTSSKS